MHTERPFFARLQELLGEFSGFGGKVPPPLTGLDKTLLLRLFSHFHSFLVRFELDFSSIPRRLTDLLLEGFSTSRTA
jgi:hypothetical protein